MRRFISHDLEIGSRTQIDHHAKTFLAIVDLESCPPMVNPDADHLDVLSHICRQAQALTAVMWETPAETLRLEFRLTDDARMSNELTRTHRLVFDGCVRTAAGRLCLTDDELLLRAARRGYRDLLHGPAQDGEHCPQVLRVPPGVINVGVFCERSSVAAIPELAHATADYTVLMRHYAFPPPRLTPVRLSGGLIPWAGEDAATRPWGGSLET